MEALIKFLRNQFSVGFFNAKLLNPKDVSDPIVGAIKSIPDTTTIKNPEEISSGIINAQKETTQAVKDITFPEQKELDLKPLYEKFDELKSAIDKKELSVTVGDTKIDVDTKGIISSVERLQQAVEGSKETIEPQEVINYTELLGEVIKNLEKPGYDYSKIEKLLDVISKKEVVIPLDEKGRVKVSVDKVSMGGRGSLSSTESAKLLTLATEAKQDTIVTALGESAITATSVDASSSGDNTIVSITNTPKLYYICLSANGANSADVTAIVKIGSTTKYKVSLKAGAIWARNIGAEKRYVTGGAGEDIIVNLSATQTVHVSVEYADV